MIKIRLDDSSSQGDLLSPEAYTDIVGNES